MLSAQLIETQLGTTESQDKTTGQGIEVQLSLVSKTETMRNLNVNFDGDLLEAGSAPVTEIAILYFDPPGPPQDYLSRFEKEAIPTINTKRSDGFQGIAFGKTYEEVGASAHAEAIPAQFASHNEPSLGQKAQAIVIISGYESIQAHETIRGDIEHFGKVAPLLVRNARAIEKFYVQFSPSN